jgi:hypothetical protein
VVGGRERETPFGFCPSGIVEFRQVIDGLLGKDESTASRERRLNDQRNQQAADSTNEH